MFSLILLTSAMLDITSGLSLVVAGELRRRELWPRG